MQFFRSKSVPAVALITLLLGVVFTLVAVVVHAYSALPIKYSWSRTIELFWRAITDAYFMVMALVVLTAAVLRPVTNISEPVNWQLRHLLFSAVMTIGMGFALLYASVTYTVWDFLAFIPVSVLFLYALRGRHLGFAIFGLMASICSLIAVSYVFTVFKSQLFSRGVMLDEWLVAAERSIFGEPLYLLIALWAKEHALLVQFSDWVYYLFFHHIALVALFLFSRGERAEQWRYVTGLSLCYLIGGVSYYLFPALGPVYHDPGSFGYLRENAEFTVEIQAFLKASTDAAIARSLKEIDTFAFIACMPSLHMAHETIMLYFSRRSPMMLLFSGLFWLSSFIAVLVLGWHYLFDVVGGVLLAAIVLAAVYWRKGGLEHVESGKGL